MPYNDDLPPINLDKIKINESIEENKIILEVKRPRKATWEYLLSDKILVIIILSFALNGFQFVASSSLFYIAITFPSLILNTLLLFQLVAIRKGARKALEGGDAERENIKGIHRLYWMYALFSTLSMVTFVILFNNGVDSFNLPSEVKSVIDSILLFAFVILALFLFLLYFWKKSIVETIESGRRVTSIAGFFLIIHLILSVVQSFKEIFVTTDHESLLKAAQHFHMDYIPYSTGLEIAMNILSFVITALTLSIIIDINQLSS